MWLQLMLSMNHPQTHLQSCPMESLSYSNSTILSASNFVNPFPDLKILENDNLAVL
jgi:hypothetical protein